MEKDIIKNAKERLSKANGIKARVQLKCIECCCDYVDGLICCGIPSCPLFQWRYSKRCIGEECNSFKKCRGSHDA